MNIKNLIFFLNLIRSQFEYGGQKYAYSKEKESTDCLFDDFGKNWLFGTLAKYCKRYSNLARERDLLKIACYCFILWLKRGFHIDRQGTKEIINTTVETKTKYFQTFIDRVGDYMGDYTEPPTSADILDIVYLMLKGFADTEFRWIYEKELLEIFALCYFQWNKDIKNKGKDQDVYNEKKKQ